MHDFNAYASRVLAHANPLPFAVDLKHMGLGLVSETGEIADMLKGVMVYGKPLDHLNLFEETGDCQWFTAGACKLAEIDFGVVMVEATDGFVTGDESMLADYSLLACKRAADASVIMLGWAVDGYTRRKFELHANLVEMMTYLRKIGVAAGYTLEGASKGNEVKLAYRNKGRGFDLAATLNRNKEGERAEMTAVFG